MAHLDLSNVQDNVPCDLNFYFMSSLSNTTNKYDKQGSVPFVQTSLSREFTYSPHKSYGFITYNLQLLIHALRSKKPKS